MAYTNSPLVDYTRISPNRNINRNHEIDTITIHCVEGQCSVESLGEWFSSESRQSSCNYGIGKDGRIGMYCEEKDRSWCSSSRTNDHRAITIEVASDATHPYTVNDTAYNALIKLLVDICKRNNIPELRWKADKSLIGNIEKQNMTVHRWFADKSCPGEYLYTRMGKIAEDVNTILNGPKIEELKQSSTISVGSVVGIKDGATYYNGGNVPSWVINKRWIVKSINGDRVVIDKSEDGSNSICSPINIKFLSTTEAANSYAVRVTTSALNIRKGPGTGYAIVGVIRDKGIYTIVDQKSTWGKLKSGEGWISLNYCKRI